MGRRQTFFARRVVLISVAQKTTLARRLAGKSQRAARVVLYPYILSASRRRWGIARETQEVSGQALAKARRIRYQGRY